MWWTPKPISKHHVWDFPHGLVVKNLPSNIGDRGWGLKIPHAIQCSQETPTASVRTEPPRTSPQCLLKSPSPQDLEAVAPGGEDFFMVSFFMVSCFDPFVLWNIMEAKPANGWDRDIGATVTQYPEGCRALDPRPQVPPRAGGAYALQPGLHGGSRSHVLKCGDRDMGLLTAVSTAISSESAPAGPGVT